MAYERQHGRIPELKSDTQEGHDIDSFICEGVGVEPKLVRRIEVKGKGVPWKAEQIVELSDRQYADASSCKVEAGVSLAEEFDYWLYVVESDSTSKLNVLPIRNPSRSASRYEFRAGTWRHLAEETTEE